MSAMPCLQCGYLRKPGDPDPTTECPNCGHVYTENDEAERIRRNLRKIEAEQKRKPVNTGLVHTAKPKRPKDDWQGIAAFRVMITPDLLRVIFWVGVAAIEVAAIIVLKSNVFSAISAALFGPVLWRLVIEMMILPFSIHESLEAIRRQLEANRNGNSG